MFHIAYLVGSRIAVHHIGGEAAMSEEQSNILFQLNLAHILVPTFNFLSIILENNDYVVISKVFDTFSIF